MAKDDTQNIILQLRARGITLTKAQLAQLNTTVKATSASMIGMGMAIAGVTLALVAIGKTMSSIVSTGREFEQFMANLKAISGATGTELLKLDSSARKLGASTKYTATEVGGLQTEFAKLGFSVKEIQQATGATLALASAVGADLAVSAEVAGQTVRGFGLNASKTSEITDVMAMSFSKSALDMTKFTESMKYVAPVAKMAGFSMKDTTAVLGVLANAGIDGSMAGTALRTIFLELSNESSKLQEAMGGGVDTLEELVVGLKGLQEEGIGTEEILELVNKKSISAFSILLDGTDTLTDLGEAFENAGGYAQRMANIQLDTLEGKLTILNSAWEGLGIAIYDSFEEPLKSATDGLTSFLQGMTAVLETPLEDKMAEQRIEMDALFGALERTNLPTEKRKELLDKINTEYEEYLPNLLSEKDSIDDIKIAREKANREFVKSIVLQTQQDRMADIIKNNSDIYNLWGHQIIKVEKAQSKLDEGTKKLESGLTGLQGIFGDNIDATEMYNQIMEKKNRIEEISNKQLNEFQVRMQSVSGVGNEYINMSEEIRDIERFGVGTKNNMIDAMSDEEKAYVKIYEQVEKYKKILEDETLTEKEREIQLASVNEELKVQQLVIDKITESMNKPRDGDDVDGDDGKDIIEAELATRREEWAKARKAQLDAEAEGIAFASEQQGMFVDKLEDGTYKAHQFTHEEIQLLADKLDAGKNYIDAMREVIEESGIDGVEIFTDEAHERDLEKMAEQLEAVDEWVTGMTDVMDAYAENRIKAVTKQHKAVMKTINAEEKAELDALKKSDAYNRASTESKKQMEDDLTKKYEDARETERVATNREIKKQFEVQKMAKYATTIMSTATAVMKAFETNPHSGGLPGSAIAIAMGAIQLATINAQEAPTMALGGLIGGELHGAGGTPIIAERDEFIMNRQAVEDFGADRLDRMNQGGGGGEMVINVSGNVMSDEFAEDVLVPKLREAIRRGEVLD